MRLVEAFAAAGNSDLSGAFALNATPSFSSLSSSDLDTESTKSFFPDKTKTLGSLMGIAQASSMRTSSRRSASTVSGNSSTKSGERSLSARFARTLPEMIRANSISKSTLWSSLFRCSSCRCTFDNPDDESGEASSLGYVLEGERGLEPANDSQPKVYLNLMFEEDEYNCRHRNNTINPLFDFAAQNSSTPFTLPNNNHARSLTLVISNFLKLSSLRAKRLLVCNPSRLMRKRNEATVHDELLQLQVTAKQMQSLRMLESKLERIIQQKRLEPTQTGSLTSDSRITGELTGTSLKNEMSVSNGSESLRCAGKNIRSECRLESSASSFRKLGCSCSNFSFDESESSVYFEDEDESRIIGS
ncbi:hypothetical protein KP509_02G039200 [Ceratopteris richardii]|nr:hypothetical protein KP509_02G039200 [Ceratopteris richardii]